MVISGSIIGSGELVLTSSLGAASGFTLLWWVLVACWSKSLVQAEFARYVIVSGDTYLRALNRIPGRVAVARSSVSWTIWVSLLSFIPGVVGMGGILGGAGQAVALLATDMDPFWITAVLALLTSSILYTGSYVRLERIMLVLVSMFTLATVISLIAMQCTPYRVTLPDLASGLEFRFPAEYLVLGLAVYGATGVNAAELSTYSYWCIEKGYAGYIGENSPDRSRVERARGWIRVLQTDVWVTLVILSCATVPFYLLGAGVLHATGQNPQGLETVLVLSNMFTQTLGSWSIWLFGSAAFCILFSSAVAGFGGTARFLPDFLVEFGWLDRADLEARRAWIRVFGVIAPVASLGIYLLVKNPLVLLSVGALAGALLLPIQSGSTLWLHKNRLEAQLRPSLVARASLWLIFLFQLALAILVIRYAVSWP
ncbi:MAG: Nramp family divalent metal transporter [Lysobacterales bacterium]